MRQLLVVTMLVVLATWTRTAAAAEKSINELPGDLARLSFVWTEPITGAIDGARQFDPVSGLWFGMLEGSVKSVERAANFFMREHASEPSRTGDPLLKYTF